MTACRGGRGIPRDYDRTVPNPEPVVGRAYAKVNLALAVGPPIPAGRPGAGYHPIASWMHAIDLFDEVTARRLPDGAASVYRVAWAAGAPRPSPIDWPVERDLGARAHRALEDAAGRPLPVELTATKRIPVGGGLGGGSSDAGAALILLDALFGLGLGRERLGAIGLSLGSDVPYFVDGAPPRPALVTGLGERIERTRQAVAELVLLLPAFGCATGPVYRDFDASPPTRLREAPVRALAATARVADAALFNDLSSAAERVEPRLAELRRRAHAAAGVPVHMTGSGSTLFVPVSPGAGAALEAKLKRELADVGVVRTRLV